MVKKIGDKKIGKINPAEGSDEIEQTKRVSDVSSIKALSGVKGTDSISGAGKRNATRVMTLAEREELFRMVSEEAKKIFPQGTLPAHKREIIEGAVKMAIDSVLEEQIDEKDDL